MALLPWGGVKEVLVSEDTILEDLYRARQKILDECQGDLMKWIERLKACEAQHQDRLVDLETVRKRRERSEGVTRPSE